MKLLTLSSLALLLLQTPALASEGIESDQWWTTTLWSEIPEGHIEDLHYEQNRFARVTLQPTGTRLRPEVEIRGSFTRKDWALYYLNRQLVRENDETPEFSFSIPFEQDAVFVTLTALGPGGQKEVQDIVICGSKTALTEQAREIVEAHCTYERFFKHRLADVDQTVDVAFTSRKNSFYIIPAVGIGTLSFTQTSLLTAAPLQLMARLSVWAEITAWLEFQLEGMGDLLSLTASSAGLRQLEVQGGLLLMPQITRNLQLGVLGGAGTASVISSTTGAGFLGRFYPVIQPTLRIVTATENWIDVYARLSPLTAGFSFFSSTQRDLNFGLVWNLHISPGMILSLRGEYSDKTLLSTTDQQIRSRSFRGSMGIGF